MKKEEKAGSKKSKGVKAGRKRFPGIGRTTVISAAAVILLLIAVYLLVFPFGKQVVSKGIELSEDGELKGTLSLADFKARFEDPSARPESVSIFMNATGVSQKHAVNIYQCGADLAIGMGLLNMSVHPFVIVGSTCVSNSSANNTVEDCLLQSEISYRFFIQSGPASTFFFENHAIIQIPEGYTGTCQITPRRLPFTVPANASNASTVPQNVSEASQDNVSNSSA